VPIGARGQHLVVDDLARYARIAHLPNTSPPATAAGQHVSLSVPPRGEATASALPGGRTVQLPRDGMCLTAGFVAAVSRLQTAQARRKSTHQPQRGGTGAPWRA
jgi:hypothetical protein